MLPLIPALAALAVQQGPAMIRGIAGWFGGSETANKVADMVEQVSGIGLTAAQQQASIEEQLGRITDPANDKYIGRDEASKWKIIRLPAFAEEDDPLGRKPGEVLWPERFDEARLRSQQRLDPLGQQR